MCTVRSRRSHGSRHAAHGFEAQSCATGPWHHARTMAINKFLNVIRLFIWLKSCSLEAVECQLNRIFFVGRRTSKALVYWFPSNEAYLAYSLHGAKNSIVLLGLHFLSDHQEYGEICRNWPYVKRKISCYTQSKSLRSPFFLKQVRILCLTLIFC